MDFGADIWQQEEVEQRNIDATVIADAQFAANENNVENPMSPENFVRSLKPLVKQIVQEELEPIIEKQDKMQKQQDEMKTQLDGVKKQQDKMNKKLEKILEEIRMLRGGKTPTPSAEKPSNQTSQL